MLPSSRAPPTLEFMHSAVRSDGPALKSTGTYVPLLMVQTARPASPKNGCSVPCTLIGADDAQIKSNEVT
jgi:hypothetical protein